jgi:hypothetical protein
MRISIIGSAIIGLVFAGVTLSSATAGDATMKGKYSACICHFGYGGNRCDTTVSCYTEGGRCTRSCSAQSE